MAHLKKIGVGNFRLPNRIYHFDSAPLTILTAPGFTRFIDLLSDIKQPHY